MSLTQCWPLNVLGGLYVLGGWKRCPRHYQRSMSSVARRPLSIYSLYLFTYMAEVFDQYLLAIFFGFTGIGLEDVVSRFPARIPASLHAWLALTASMMQHPDDR